MGNPEGMTEKLKPGRRVNRQPSLVTAGTNGPYSWWWDSHRPKNSKWVQENLTDMDLKIKAMLKLIEQDADSFAQRAEMYYKKRPELVHLVEEFYRAYRALAERCDHISGELRQIHHSISEALPNQIQHMLNGDSPGGPEGQMNPDDIEDAREASRLQGLKHLSKILSEYSTIEEKVSELRDELRCVQEENQKMKDTWSSQVDEINNLKGQIQSLTEKNEDLVKQSLEKEASEREKLETAIQSFQDLRGKMDRKEEENRRLEEELFSREEMIKAIEEKVNAAERERDNLQMEMEQIISKMSLLVEELTLMRNQEQKLKERLQEETNQTRNLEVTLTSCQESLNESNEQQKKLTEEIQVGTERLKDADTRVKLLEDEIVRLQTDNQNLMEKISSASSSVKKLEDDVLQLKQERLTLLNEVAFRVDQRNDLQKQLYSSQEEKSSIEQTYQEILKQLGSLGLDSGNLKSSFLGLQEENQKLKELGHKYQDECLEMSKLSKNLEQELLEEKRTFEEAKSLHTDEIKKLNNELERRTVLSQDFQNQNLELLADKDDKTKKIDILEKDLQASQEQCSSLHTENSKLKNELTSSVDLIDRLQEQLDTSKVEKESLQLEITACNTQKSSLEKEVCFLKEEGNHLKGELQEETEKVKSCHVEIGKLQDLVAQLQGRNVTLMEDSENHINEKLIFENRVKELEEELHRKEEERSALMSDLSRELVTSVEQMENLKKLQQLLSIPNLEKKMDGVGAESMYMLNAISEKVSALQTDVLQLQNENNRLSMVESSLNTYLEDLETRMASLQTEKASLSEESEIRHNSLEDSRKEIQALQESAEDLKTELQYSFEREACLERNIEDLKHSLVSSQDEQLLLHAQHQKILEDYYALQKKAGELQTKVHIREEESCKHLTEALENHIYGSLLESCVVDREAHIKQLMEQMNALVKEKRELENDAQRGEEISQSLKDEVFQLKEVSRLYEEEKQHTIELQENFNALRQKNEDICLKIEANNNLLEQKDNIIVELSHKLQENEEQRSALQNDMQSVEQMHAVSQTEREELNRQLVLLRDDVNHLKEALSMAVDDRAFMEKQLQDLENQKETVSKELALSVSREQKLASDLKALSEKEESTKNQLLIQTEQNKQLELEIEKLYGSLQMKQMENTLLKDGNEKIYDLCKLLATKSREVQGQQEGILKQDINIEDELARTKEVGRSATEMKKVNSDAGAKVSGILEMLLPMKDDVFSLKEEVLGNINSLRNDAQMVQVALEQMQDTKSELFAEAEIRAQEVLRLQAEVDAIQHILIELKRKNQTLQDESQRNAKELWNAKARLNNVMSKNINLESQNRSLKAELHLQAQKAFQIQEERNVVESEHNVLSSEVENLKSELKESKDLEGYFLRLFEILLGQHVEVASLDIESCRFAEEKLMRILDELICLRNENAKLKNEALYEYHDYERKNVSGSRAEAMSVLISKSLGNGRANQREFQNKEEDSSGVDLLKNKCSRLEFQVQKLSEKAEMFETKSREAQQMANKLEEMQQTLSDMQPIQLQIQALQTRVRSLKKENTRLRSEMKGELTPSRSFKHREGSFIKEINIGDEDDTPLIQEEKEVVVDESKKIDTRTSETQEIDTLMDDNRKYWNRVSHFTKQTQSLQNSVQELQQKLKSVKSNKKSKGEKWGGVDMNSIEKQLKELNIHVMQLAEHNTRLKKDVKFGFAWANSMHDLNGQEQKLKVDEEVPILCHQNSKIAERLDVNTDKARALDMEVQRIRLILSRIPTKPTEEASKMRVPLRAFLVGSKKDQSKRHGCCSCVTPSTIE